MKVEWNHDEQIETHVCLGCGYRHSKEYKAHGVTLEGDKPFIEMEGFEFHSTDKAYYYPSHNTHTVYACPKCGVLQIQI